jgi:hypothetical protein
MTRDVSTSGSRIFITLIMRTVLFAIFGFVMIGVFSITGGENDAVQEAEKWWAFQAIMANIATFVILRILLKREGLTYGSILHFQKVRLGKDLLRSLLYIVICFPIAAIGLYGLSFLAFGHFQPPDNMMQAIPLWAAIVALIVFPITNALVEIPTYMGYAFPRIEKQWGKKSLAILLTALFLAIQHGPLPLVFDGPYWIWRMFSFIPLAIVLAFIYSRTRNNAPLVIAHYVMDLQMVVYVLLASLSMD